MVILTKFYSLPNCHKIYSFYSCILYLTHNIYSSTHKKLLLTQHIKTWISFTHLTEKTIYSLFLLIYISKIQITISYSPCRWHMLSEYQIKLTNFTHLIRR